jgi:BolA protein
MQVEDEMRKRLEAAFSPTSLEIENQSRLHAGHAGDDGSGESHFSIIIAAPSLQNLSRIDRERQVHAALDDIMGKIHALSIKIL